MNKIPLQKSIDYQQFFMEVASSSSDIVVVADQNRHIVFVNPTACKKTGYSKKELLGAKIPILYRKENQSKYTSRIFTDLHKKGRWSGEMEVRKKDGTTFCTDTTIIAFRDTKGDLAGTIGIGRDLSEKRLLDQRIWQSESHLQEVVESMADALYICDVAGKILMCNKTQCDMLGYHREEIVGTRFPYPWIDASDNLKLQRGMKLLALSLLNDQAGKPKGCVVSVRDVTDVRFADGRRRANDQIHRLMIEVKRKAERLQTLQEINSFVLHNADVSRIFRSITSGVKKLVEHDLAGIYIYDPDQQSFLPYMLSKKTPFSRKLAKFPLPLGEGIIGEAAISGKVVWVNNAQLDPRSRYPEGMKPEKEHFIAVPLKGRESIFGVLVVARNRDPQFIEEEVLVVQSFADAATVALENARLFYELSKLQSDPVKSAVYRSSGKAGLRLPKRIKPYKGAIKRIHETKQPE
ncbi:MAG: PAS domain S-box protein [Ignavibacteriales bacterium]|nr:PAS domain S-box protein [Ignavibacteriales bacterium]